MYSRVPSPSTQSLGRPSRGCSPVTPWEGEPIVDFSTKSTKQTHTYALREATAEDASAIIALTMVVNMTNATSFVWDLTETQARLKQKSPLAVVACDLCCSGTIVGVAGIDVGGMSGPLRVLSIGSRLSNASAGVEYDIPSSHCMCRGLLVHPDHEGKGLGSRLHRARLWALFRADPDTPAVILSARGTTMEESMTVLGHLIARPRDDGVTPPYENEALMAVTYRTSKSVVRIAHGREREGWRFVGVDVSDGGPVWSTSVPLREVLVHVPSEMRKHGESPRRHTVGG